MQKEKISIKRAFAAYFDSVWIPITVAGFFLVVFAWSVLKSDSDLLRENLGYLFDIFLFVGIVAAIIWNLIKKRWKKALGIFLLFVLLIVASMITLGIAMLFSTGADNFGKDIIIPPDMKMGAPGYYKSFDDIPEPTMRGEESIRLVGWHQGGVYRVLAYVNPGEAGLAYLKVFEATRNTPLSESRLPKRSTQQLQWSADPDEKFLYNARITVYEGDWGTYYPARFELWFVPKSGAPERKLIEKIFKIEGWMR